MKCDLYSRNSSSGATFNPLLHRFTSHFPPQPALAPSQTTAIDQYEYRHTNKRLLRLRLRESLYDARGYGGVTPEQQSVRRATDNLSGFDIIKGVPIDTKRLDLISRRSRLLLP